MISADINFQDSESLGDIVLSSCPEVIRTLKAQTDSMNSLGVTGTNIYYCDGYVAAIHCDDDESWSLCSQLEWCAGHHEYGFAYAEWGVYIVTRPRTVWCVLNVINCIIADLDTGGLTPHIITVPLCHQKHRILSLSLADSIKLPKERMPKRQQHIERHGMGMSSYTVFGVLGRYNDFRRLDFDSY